LKKQSLFIKMLIFAVKNFDYLKAYKKFDVVKTILTRANMELGKWNILHPNYETRVKEFNYAALNLVKGRYLALVATKEGSGEKWKEVFYCLNEANRVGNELYKLIVSEGESKIDLKPIALESKDTEIFFTDDVPIPPEIQPIVILKGSDFQMGYQYAQQVIEIFGSWIFEQKAGILLSGEEDYCIVKWEEQIKQHTPELIDFMKGWSKGAKACGINMSYHDVLVLWVGHKPPESNYLGMTTELGKLPPPACSGAAAWGSASVDGKLVTASSGDYDPCFSVTMMLYPESGNNYIFTPFSVVGDVPFLGPTYMFGHPGLNEKGLAYVHHGGNPKMIEPKTSWGYGIRRAASIMHVLRFADNAKQALEIELSFPIGDIGLDSGTAGGFYADSTYGYVVESRDPVLVREAGLMGEEDFLYANNSAIHPGANQAGWMESFQNQWKWDKHTGWYPKEFEMVNKWGTVDKKVNSALKMIYNGSSKRNLYLYQQLEKHKGNIDIKFMKNLFKESGNIPDGDWKKIIWDYKKHGKWGRASTGNAMNGLLGILKPDEGIYAICVGEASRGLAPTSPLFGSSNPMYGETNAFWEIKLTDDPKSAVAYAREKAEELLNEANKIFTHKNDSVSENSAALLKKAIQCKEEGNAFEKMKEGMSNLNVLSKIMRLYTKAQIYSQQFIQMFIYTDKKP
jgi:hypothetical protein